ncbi:hypothetical protein CCM_04865 [Cordyceps militaris CM01]|uniref:Uncharacterized protein n=1 Tax=Cordyceps militaris (strain CM01) TaxID=983644 RepID=G3JEZ8_CORMM|nr:uncharacterized protein CCM_04865 [Cordyceps militaris CM01]EGX93491.1 hypothetical protein CCM_04865 [Cordyceps militaris CM01]
MPETRWVACLMSGLPVLSNSVLQAATGRQQFAFEKCNETIMSGGIALTNTTTPSS